MGIATGFTVVIWRPPLQGGYTCTAIFPGRYRGYWMSMPLALFWWNPIPPYGNV